MIDQKLVEEVRQEMRKEFPVPEQFPVAATITAHKAQGSEWPRVAVFHQRHSMSRMGDHMALRWLYTAASRAKERLLMVNC